MKISIFAAASLVLILTACASGRERLLEVVSSSERTVIVQALYVADAQSVAERECKKYGRAAQFSSVLPGTIEYVFNCQI